MGTLFQNMVEMTEREEQWNRNSFVFSLLGMGRQSGGSPRKGRHTLRAIATHLLFILLSVPRVLEFMFDNENVTKSWWKKSNPLLLILCCEREAILNCIIYDLKDGRKLWSYNRGIPLEILLRE
jgi:hypothetical protein